MTRADLKHCGKIPDATEELNKSVREGRIESIHSIKSLEGMGSSNEKRIGPNIVPCGMPHLIFCNEDNQLFIDTY